MRHFCTLFDSNYLTRGLALYESLQRTEEDFHLHVYCFDEASRHTLLALQLPHLTVVGMEEFETPELLRVKPSRSKAEYCWTCTPHIIRHALERPAVPAVTYVDADTYFWQKPSILLEEMERQGASIQITPHRYSAEYDHSVNHGVYCVQFQTFQRDTRGLNALQWWQDRCIEWCYSRCEDGRFGDQKYLDDWPERFAGVNVLAHLGGGVAPWNVQQYEFGDENGILQLSERATGRRFPVVFFHFHGLKFYVDGKVELAHHRLSRDAISLLYRPYVAHLERIAARLEATEGPLRSHGAVMRHTPWKRPRLTWQRIRSRSYHIYRLTDLPRGIH